MNRWKRYVAPFVIAALMLPVACIVLEQLYWSGSRQKLVQLDQQVGQLQTQQNMLQKSISSKARQQMSWQRQAQQLRSIRDHFDPLCDSTCVVQFFAAAADGSSISIDVFDWQPEARKAQWAATPFHVVLHGEYAQLLDFFQRLNQSYFVVVFEQVSWKRATREGSQVELVAQASLMRPLNSEEQME